MSGRVSLATNYIYEPPGKKPMACVVVAVRQSGAVADVYVFSNHDGCTRTVYDVPTNHLFCPGNDGYDDFGFLLPYRTVRTQQ